MRGLIVGAFSIALAVGCGRLSFERLSDAAAPDTGGDADATDAAMLTDAAVPTDAATPDAPTDAAILTDASDLDAAIDAGDAAIDASADAHGLDATAFDAGLDADVDAGVDAGLPDPTYPPLAPPAITSTGYHTCVLRAGEILCWGRNDFGQLGLDDALMRTTPVRVSLPNNAMAIQVSAGEQHTCAIDDRRALYCWGQNQAGQLGLGDLVDRDQPTPVVGIQGVVQVSAGYGFTCAITEDNALWCWGDNNEGGLGLDDGSVPIASTPNVTRSGTFNDWIQIGAGQGRACGLRHPGVLWCAGRHGFYGFGDNSNTPLQIRAWTQASTFNDWTRISISQDGGCGLRSDRRAYCWGSFASAPPTVNMTPLPITTEPWRHGAAGVFNACGIHDTGLLFCWGRNAEGQLGISDLSNQATAVVAGIDTDWSSVVLGRFHTCAHKNDGRVYCTGENNNGQLGLGDQLRRSAFTQVTLP